MISAVIVLLCAIVSSQAQGPPGLQPGPPGGTGLTGSGPMGPRFGPGTGPGGMQPGVGPVGPGRFIPGRPFQGGVLSPTSVLTDQSWMFNNQPGGMAGDSNQLGGSMFGSNQLGGSMFDTNQLSGSTFGGNQLGGSTFDTNQLGGVSIDTSLLGGSTFDTSGLALSNDLFGFGGFMSPSSPLEMLMMRVAANPNNYRYGTCVFNETWSPVRGRLDFRQFLIGEGRPQVSVRVQLSGLPASVGEVERGVHVHEFGDTGDGCARVGPHFNPNQTPHGSRRHFAYLRHVGDLGNIRQSPEGLVSTQFVDSVISLEGVNNIVGRAIAIKFERDDEGMGQTRDSQVNGNTHTPIACCTIGRTTARNWYNPMSVQDIQTMAATGMMPYYTVNQNLFGANPGLGTNMGMPSAGQGPGMMGTGPNMAGGGPGMTGSRPGMMGSGPGMMGSGPGMMGGGTGMMGTGTGMMGTGTSMMGTGTGMMGSGPRQPGTIQFGAGTFTPGGAPGQTLNFGATGKKK